MFLSFWALLYPKLEESNALDKMSTSESLRSPSPSPHLVQVGSLHTKCVDKNPLVFGKNNIS